MARTPKKWDNHVVVVGGTSRNTKKEIDKTLFFFEKLIVREYKQKPKKNPCVWNSNLLVALLCIKRIAAKISKFSASSDGDTLGHRLLSRQPPARIVVSNALQDVRGRGSQAGAKRGAQPPPGGLEAVDVHPPGPGEVGADVAVKASRAEGRGDAEHPKGEGPRRGAGVPRQLDGPDDAWPSCREPGRDPLVYYSSVTLLG